MEAVVTTGAINRAKLQSNHHHQPTNIQFYLQAGCPSWRPTNIVKALKGKYHIPWTCLPQAHLVVQLCLWPLIAPGYLGAGLPCLSSALWCQYPRMSPNWILFEMVEVLVTTGAIWHAKLQSNQDHQQTNTQFLTDRMSFLSLINSVKALKG